MAPERDDLEAKSAQSPNLGQDPPPAAVSARQRSHHTTAASAEGPRMQRRSAVAPFDSTALENLEFHRFIDTKSSSPTGVRCQITTVSNYRNNFRRNLLDAQGPGCLYSASSLMNGRFGVDFLLRV